MNIRHIYPLALLAFSFLAPVPVGADVPKAISYSAKPNDYFNERADEVAKIYDGLFFTIGSWDDGVATNLGTGPGSPATTDWKDRVRENLIHLKAAGVTENLLGVYFGSGDPWPSPETLLSATYQEKMVAHFAQVGEAAEDLGFRGVSIDVEYPYPRYELDHETYTYDGYTVDDLLSAANGQGRSVMEAVLDGFPEAVVFVLPGVLWTRPIEREFTIGMLEAMAERDAPGGCHLGYEWSYYVTDAVSQVVTPRIGDCMADFLFDAELLDYWKRRCTVAPGVWPLQMEETPAKDYPKRSWSEEMAERRVQMEVLRTVAKRYVWSYTGRPVWCRHSPEIEERYGLPLRSFEGVEEAVPLWHDILSDRSGTSNPKLLALCDDIRRYDSGEIDSVELCDRFGTPGEWLVLAPLGNPLTKPEFAAPGAILPPIRFDEIVHGRDGIVRWFRFSRVEPTGAVHLRGALDWRNTDNCSAHAVATISAGRETRGYLQIGWDDGILIRLDNEIVFDRRTYPKKGHGMLHRQKYLFEERVPVTIPTGESMLAVTSFNSHGNWGFNMRFTDRDGFPLEGITFALPNTGEH